MFSQVVLTSDAHRGLCQATRAAWPHELVAVLGGARIDDIARIDTVLVLANSAAVSHGEFAVEALAFARSEHQLRRDGRQWLGFAHSHPRGTAAPSARDRRELWRDCLQLILATGSPHDEPSVCAFVLHGDRTQPQIAHIAIAMQAAS